MIVGGTVTAGEHTTENDAPPSSGPSAEPARFSTRSAPPTMKQAGPALRLLAGEALGDGRLGVVAELRAERGVRGIARRSGVERHCCSARS